MKTWNQKTFYACQISPVFLASGTDEGFNMAVSALKVILIDYSKRKVQCIA
jgi:hypothetical protein